MDSQRLGTSNTDTCVYQVDFTTPQDDAAPLNDLSAQLLAFVSSISSNYLWHKQSFNLNLTALSFSTPAHQHQHRWLEGKTDVTDAVDDEWFIVWLLREITKKWKDAVAGIEDDDGEFLLIEAADVLPNWVTPQNAANRLWIHQGHLHLVSLEHKSELPFAEAAEEPKMNPSFDPDQDSFIDRATAIQVVRDSTIDTRASREVEETVWARINGYPGKIKEHHHRTLTYLPTDIALALEDTPSLITEAVGAFYERDPNMLKACNTMTRFPPTSPLPSPSTADNDSMSDSTSLPQTVLVPTLLTRPIYSQLVLQRFYAPKPFEKVGWTDAKLGKEDERRRSVGMKIACGFEMLYKQTSAIPRVSSSNPLESFDSSTSPEYQLMLKSLTEKGFFEGEVQGSEGWKAKEVSVRRGWIQAKMNLPTLSFAQRVDEAVARCRSSSNPLSSRITSPATLSVEAAKRLEDSENWLSIDEQGLEDLLRERGEGQTSNGLDEEGFSSDDEDGEEEGEKGTKSKAEKDEERRTRKAARRLEDMAGKVEDFVQGRGAVDGALFDDEQSTNGDSDDDDADEDEDMEMPKMTAEERASRLEKLVAPLDTSEWGQQTATNSETTAAPSLSSAATSNAPDRPSRPAKFEAEKYDGASSDSDSSDEAMPGEEGLNEEEDEEGEDAPAVIDEDETLDMGEEMDEFLKFATETLGLSEEQYQNILGERKQRGAFVPGPSKDKKINVIPSDPSKSTTPKPEKKASAAPEVPSTPLRPSRNPNLADFDSLMEKMENELSSVKKGAAPAWKSSSASSSTSSTKPTASTAASKAKPILKTESTASTTSSNRVKIETLSDSDDDGDDADEDVDRMDAELSELLKGMGGNGEGGTMDYNLVKNFLDSFQSQGGFAGPAGNLSGRMGFNLPRDSS